METVCIIGHSHGHMLRNAVKRNNVVTKYHYIHPLIGTGELSASASYILDNKNILNDNVEALLNEIKKTQELNKIHLLTAFHGNGYNQLYMIEDDEPFDFILKNEKENVNAIFVSKQVVELAISKYIVIVRNALSILSQKGLGTLACLQTPPPNPSTEYMMEKLRLVRSDLADNFKVSSSTLRYKLWSVMDTLYREMCNELGVLYVCAPEDTRDSNGFLLEKYWADMSHANKEYGSIILAEHQKLIGCLD